MDFNSENMKRVMKYLVEGLVVALACFAIPKRPMEFEEILFIALVAASTFGILDTYMSCKPGLLTQSL